MEQIQQCYIDGADEDGKPRIDSDYFKNIILDRITSYMQETGTDRNHIDGNDLLAVYRQTQEAIFKPKQNSFPPVKCNIPYSEYNIGALLDMYVSISTAYKIPPSLYAFSILTGIDEGTVQRYLTPERYEMVKLRREMLGNKLYQNTMGQMAIANHDPSYGLEWEKKSTIERETIRRGLGVQDLPRLAET